MVAKAREMAEEADSPRVRSRSRLSFHDWNTDLSLEDDDDMQARWAALLANAANPDQEVTVHPTFPGILKELGSAEARLLDAVVNAFGGQIERLYMEEYGLSEDRIGHLYGELGLSPIPWARSLRDVSS